MVHLEEQLVPVTPKPNVEKLETGIITSGKATRVVEIYNEDESECITIGASGSTRTPEVREIVSSFTKIDAEKIQLISKVGVFPVKQRLSDEVASKVVALGVRSFARAHQKYDHTIVVIGAGLGGMQTMLSLIQGGRKDIVCLDRLSAFGGHSWLVVSNKYTKLQTESGNYHVDYLLPDAPATSEVEGEPYKSWPTRDQLLKMFREGAKRHSLSNFTKFNTNVEKVRPLPDGSGYSVHTSPANGEGEGELIVASAVLAWPGNLCNYRELEWPGEEDFGGYIAYASFSKVDYREAEGKVCILYGHGAFTIENAMKLSTPVMWPDHQVLFALIGGKDNFRSHLPAANKTTAILFVKEMTHMPQQHLTKEVDDGIAKGRLKPLEEVVHLDEGEEVPLHSHQDREKLRRSSKGKGKGKGGKDGKGKGKGKEPQGKQDAGVRERMDKYLRSSAGTKAELKVTGDKKLQTQAKRRQRNDREAAFRLAKAEVLQTAEAGVIEAEDEDTTRLTQQEILESVGVGVARKYFNFDLPYGPYNCSLSRNGAHLLVGGRKGHVAFMHLESMKIFSELHVKETVRAVQTLHNENLYAVAQKKYTYIYDNEGTELHCIKQFKCPTHLDFLPYHFLLVSTGDKGEISWRDVTYGAEVALHRTHLGGTTCLRQNPKNAVMHLGHNKGQVTLWTPNVKEPVVKMACHNGQVTALAVHGNYMITAGAEAKWKVWDLRTYQQLHVYGRKYGHAVSSIDVSMTGMVALGSGAFLDVFKDVFSSAKPMKPYIREMYKGQQIECLRFRPFEDVCCVGHTGGFASLIVPGAGKANFDSFEANPFENKKQRREREVQSLLDKLQPDSIMLDPDRIGEMNPTVVKAYKEEAAKKEEAEKEANKKASKKMRGKNKVGNRMKRKALKKGAEQRLKTKDRLGQAADGDDGDDDDDEDDDDEEAGGDAGGVTEEKASNQKSAPPGVGAALSRFYGKRRRKT